MTIRILPPGAKHRTLDTCFGRLTANRLDYLKDTNKVVFDASSVEGTVAGPYLVGVTLTITKVAVSGQRRAGFTRANSVSSRALTEPETLSLLMSVEDWCREPLTDGGKDHKAALAIILKVAEEAGR